MPAPKKRQPEHPAERPAVPVSEQLRAIIKARGMSAYAVALAARVNPSVMSRFMAGERGITTPTLDAVCLALGIELRETRRHTTIH